MRIAAKRRADWLMSDEAYAGRSRLVCVGGSLVEVVELGRGEPIILVPGLAGGWKLLTPLARSLAKRHRVILYGFRDELNPLTGRPAGQIGDYARDLAGLIGELRLERPTIFGVSFGGAVALEYAVDHPHQVGRLVLSGVESRFQTTLASTIARRVLERFPLPADNPFVNQFFNLFHGGKPESAAMARFVIERCWETDQGVMARRLAMLESFDIADRLWQLESPTLVLGGSRDVVVPPDRQKALASSISGARFERIEGAGHVGFLTHSSDVAQHVEKLSRGGRPSLA
ncbi:alpha/beta fold hydrolase [Tundrisphaera lichenicola]|uniref:alpha/beta fold hydrolase n=1 Tax=Tundrisphaera lichenicola TaxID=2029860 RepID=UPI003EBFD221